MRLMLVQVTWDKGAYRCYHCTRRPVRFLTLFVSDSIGSLVFVVPPHDGELTGMCAVVLVIATCKDWE